MNNFVYKSVLLEMRESSLIHAYNLGRAAYKDGKSASQAPDTRTTGHRDAWLRGYLADSAEDHSEY